MRLEIARYARKGGLMTTISRGRIWAETIVGGFAAVMAVVTIFWRDWLEAVFGWDPDHHNGSAEWLIVLGLAIVAAVLLPLARWERRRLVGPSPAAAPGIN